MKITIVIAVSMIVAIAGLAAHAQPQFTHARFVEGDRSMKNLVRFPDVDFDIEITITCTGHATAKGRLQDARCSAPNDPDLAFTMAVSRHFKSSRLIPATVNGKAEEVDFQFVVIFRKTGDAKTIDIYHHNMKNVDRLGIDYVGAQRYSVHPWPRRCNEFTREDLIMEVAIVNELGIARDFDVLSANFSMSAACREGFATHIENGRWIPASLDGEYVESIWTIPRFNSNAQFKRTQ